MDIVVTFGAYVISGLRMHAARCSMSARSKSAIPACPPALVVAVRLRYLRLDCCNHYGSRRGPCRLACYIYIYYVNDILIAYIFVCMRQYIKGFDTTTNSAKIYVANECYSSYEYIHPWYFFFSVRLYV